MDRNAARAFNARLAAALADFAKQEGYAINVKRCTFGLTNGGLEVTLKVDPLNESGERVSEDAMLWPTFVSMYGKSFTRHFTAEDLGRSFAYGRQTHVIAGARRNRAGWSVVTTCNGKDYRWKPNMLSVLFASGECR